MAEVVVIHLNQNNIDCGICGAIDNQDHPGDRKAVPFFNGEPTTSDSKCDGYHAVCAKCYNRWDAWDERTKTAKRA